MTEEQLLEERAKAHQLPLSYESLETAFAALKAQGETFVTKKELPPLPEVPGVKDLPNSMSDINCMGERFKKLYFGPHKDQFRARVNEILRRAREEK